MALPVNVGVCKVVGRFLRFVVDGVDADRDPEGFAIPNLAVQFTPNMSPVAGSFVNAGVQTIFLVDPIVTTTDSSGVLVGPDGTEGIYLVASDDPDLSPTGWTYTAIVSGPGIALSFSFIAPAGGTVDLASVVPVPADPGEALAVWLEAVQRTEAARDEVLAALANGGGGGGGTSVSLAPDPVYTGVGVLTIGPGAAPTESAPAVVTHPASQSAVEGETVTFTASASGSPAPTVKWQLSTNGGTSWTDITGATATTYTTPTLVTGDNNGQYRAVFSNSIGTAVTSAATLTVGSASGSPVVTLEPVHSYIATGATTHTWTAAASGAPAPTVQWQWFINPGTGTVWTDIAGKTSTTLTLTETEYQSPPGSTQRAGGVRAVFTNVNGTATTDGLAQAFVEAPVVITVQPTDKTVNAGSTVNLGLGVTTTGTSKLIEWFRSSDGGATWVSVTPAPSALAIHNRVPQYSENGWKFRFQIRNHVSSLYSNTITLTVNAIPPAITTHPVGTADSGAGGYYVVSGQPQNFSAAASGAPVPDAQWQQSNLSTGPWTDIIGENLNTLTLFGRTASDPKLYVRCVYTNDGGTATTNAAWAISQVPVAITAQPTDQIANVGGQFILSLTYTGTNKAGSNTVLWYRSTDGGATFGTTAVGNGASYTFNEGGSNVTGTKFRAVVANDVSSVTSNIVTLTVV